MNDNIIKGERKIARKLREWYPGAIYHLMHRGVRRTEIFSDEADYQMFLEILKVALDKVFVCKRVTDIGEKDRYETCAAKIDRIPLEYNEDYAEELEKIDPIGWMFTYPSDMGNKAVEFPQDPSFLKVMEYTLKSLDPAIKSVEKSKEVVNTFIVHMQSGDLLVQDGEVIKKNILSSGTKAGIDIA